MIIISEKRQKKMGRPFVSNEARNHRVSLRATETTVRKFDKCSEILNKSKTDLLEEMIDDLYRNACKNAADK